ncbi:low temperature requirement protein A [Cellulomonas composti]|uniref:Membrane protein n=1 Tax=Cellulomonas composti TaxID=266130 RepID=A0A511JBR6_9CELL|nr:low temperature requirement protein A [Cellulomonas composti]GEL95404.1 membrane protein [Cellulomonas composti]
MATPSDSTGRWGLRTDLLRHGDDGDSSRVGYVELFFDLVFVFAVTQLSHSLIAHPDGTTLAHTLILGWAVWFLWIDTTWVTNWLDPDRVPVRVMLLVLMLLGLLMSSAIPEAFDGKAMLFAAPFVAIQVGRSVFTALAMGRHWPENAVNFVRISMWLATSGVLWLVGATVDAEQRIWWWGAAALLDLAAPRAMFWVPGLGPSRAATWSVRGHHMAERVSLFVIISLGESIIVAGAAFAELEIDPTSVTAFLAAFASTVLMWLLYFDRSERTGSHYLSSRRDPGMVAQTAYTYIPYLLVMGIVLTAVGDELVLQHPHGHEGATDGWTAGLVCGAAAVYLVGNALFRRATGGPWSWPHLTGAALAVALVALRGGVTPLTLSWLTNGVLALVFAADVLAARRRSGRDAARSSET